MKIAFISVFDDSLKGRRAQRLADELETYYDVERYGFGSCAKPLSEYAGFEPILFYYVFDDPLFEKILAYSQQRVGYVFVDDVDLITAKHPSFLPGEPSLSDELDLRGIDAEEKNYLLRQGISAYPPGTGFFQIETDENGSMYRWTKQEFSILVDEETDEVRLQAYTDIPCLVYSNSEVKGLTHDHKQVLSFDVPGEKLKLTVVKPRLQYLLFGEWRQLGIRIYEIDFVQDGDLHRQFEHPSSESSPRRQLADTKPFLPERGQIISPYKTLLDHVEAGQHVPYEYEPTTEETNETLVLSDKSTRDEINYVLKALDYFEDVVFLRSRYCDVEEIIANNDLTTEITVVETYTKKPWRVIYPYDDDKSYPLLSKYTPGDVLFLDNSSSTETTPITRQRLDEVDTFNPPRLSAEETAKKLSDILV